MLRLDIPIVQAPMAGVSTPAMAAAVSNAGGLGSIAIGAAGLNDARAMVEAVRARTDHPFAVNVFVHADPEPDPYREALWLDALSPLFVRYGARPPGALKPVYRSFAQDDAALALLVEAAPAVVSFHFGLPDRPRVEALRSAGCILMATATSLAEAIAARDAGIDAVVAQGWEAGGHRGMFDPSGPDERMSTDALTRLLVLKAGLPVIAAGGMMDGRDVRSALRSGAVAAQLGTAFILCPESEAGEGYRAKLLDGDGRTEMTAVISGRPARCLVNRFTKWGDGRAGVPDYPVAYDAGKALNAAALLAGEYGFGAQWAGGGAARSRSVPAGELVRLLAKEAA